MHKTGTVFDFAIVSPDARSSGYRMRNIGSICSGIPADSDKIMLKVRIEYFALLLLLYLKGSLRGIHLKISNFACDLLLNWFPSHPNSKIYWLKGQTLKIKLF